VRTRKARLRVWAGYLLLILFAAFSVLFPLWVVIINSAKPQGEASLLGAGLPQHWNIIDNYRTVIDQGQIWRGLFNTLVVVVPSVLIILLIGSAASWVFARGRGRTAHGLYYLSIAGILVPPSIVTSVLVLRQTHLLGSQLALIMFYVGIYLSFAIFIITGFVKTIPYELEESAYIDGASPMWVYLRIILPLLRPVLATTFVVLVLATWNDFFYPFYILQSTSQNTLTLGLYNFAQANVHEVKWQLVFADVILTSLPLVVIYFAAQRRVIAGLMGGALR
jgi:raffinose/stachyose/melibiose transport system permease protein